MIVHHTDVFTTATPQKAPLPGPCHTITDDHAGLQRFISEGLVAYTTGPLVDVEEAAHSVARTVKVVQPRLPQSCTCKRIQKVAWGGNGGLELEIPLV